MNTGPNHTVVRWLHPIAAVVAAWLSALGTAKHHLPFPWTDPQGLLQLWRREQAHQTHCAGGAHCRPPVCLPAGACMAPWHASGHRSVSPICHGPHPEWPLCAGCVSPSACAARLATTHVYFPCTPLTAAAAEASCHQGPPQPSADTAGAAWACVTCRLILVNGILCHAESAAPLNTKAGPLHG